MNHHQNKLPARSGRMVRYAQRGSTLVESIVAMLLICLILFGLLQIFMLYTTQEFTDYASFRTARSLSVGFNDQLARVEARTRAFPVSGTILEPSEIKVSNYIDDFVTTSSYKQNDGVYDYYYRVRIALLRYMEGVRYMRCEYWDADDNDWGTNIFTKITDRTDRVAAEVGFEKYPLRLPFAKAFLSEGTMDLKTVVELRNHAAAYLED